MAVPNIAKAELHPDWVKLFDDTTSLDGTLRTCLVLVYEDGSQSIASALKHEKIDGVPSALYDITPSKDVVRMIVSIYDGSKTINLISLYPPEGENVMKGGERYTFRMFIRLKGAEWLGVKEQAQEEQTQT